MLGDARSRMKRAARPLILRAAPLSF